MSSKPNPISAGLAVFEMIGDMIKSMVYRIGPFIGRLNDLVAEAAPEWSVEVFCNPVGSDILSQFRAGNIVFQDTLYEYVFLMVDDF
jgi:hypothetical protein